VTFFLGLILGAAIVFSQGIYTPNNWLWYCIAWLILIPYTIAKVWGLILAPILAILFIGLVWYDWNRLIGLGTVALLTALTVFISAKRNPFTESGSFVEFISLSGVCVVLVATGAAIEIFKKRRKPANDGACL